MQKEQKKHLRRFLRYYPDDRLAALLAHAQDGKLVYQSCCCFIGSLTADHALQGNARDRIRDPGVNTHHLEVARGMAGAAQAEQAFEDIGAPKYPKVFPTWWERLTGTRLDKFLEDRDEARRRLVIPIIRAEIKRRAMTAGAGVGAEVRVKAEVKERVKEKVYV